MEFHLQYKTAKPDSIYESHYYITLHTLYYTMIYYYQYKIEYTDQGITWTDGSMFVFYFFYFLLSLFIQSSRDRNQPQIMMVDEIYSCYGRTPNLILEIQTSHILFL